ncbi:F-box/kelch-repeat protein OR23 [Pyrus x bretschneideri]|uniref:F-box/kelch-repeat protein OR23 n=1 Tax=Pyrus x bretschneideri TaxID=225117 RepID=UPI0020303E8B|nr:F-box/kelch-repeat protein OR23 [Pyrus x bretschneideri]XP_048429936.1 F-box/kelch-repeat protein OR23 [Pyrus x bretschneideri]
MSRFGPPSPHSSSSSSPPLIPIGESPTLIPGLPNDIAALILSFVPFSHQARRRPTCKSWRLFLSSKTLIALRQTHNRTNPKPPPLRLPLRPVRRRPLPLRPSNPSLVPPPANALQPPRLRPLQLHLPLRWAPPLRHRRLPFDTRSFPIDLPSPSSAIFRFDFSTSSWDFLAPMLTPRGSFACAAIPKSGEILVAGGGSRHTLFSAAGSRTSSVERYDIGRNDWVAMDGLPGSRTGCAGFFVGDGEKRGFWVMGGYGESRTRSGVFPVDEHYRDAVVMELKNGNGGCR